MHNTVIRNCLLVDGTGGERREADIAIKDGIIVGVASSIDEPAEQVIDAEGMMVMPGFVDIHTHYDGQATWDDLLDPSASHGVTTVVMGNCGVGFAPVKRGTEDTLIELMEGVEDIPGTALYEGIEFRWETFPEYLDVLDECRWSMDVATQLPHGALRVFVMGDRGVNNEPANEADVAAMAQATAEAMEAGALGFSSSRILGHMSLNGMPVPGTFAHEDELFAIGRAMTPFQTVFEVVPGGIFSGGGDNPQNWKEQPFDTELNWMNRLSLECNLPVTYFMVESMNDRDIWKGALEASNQANKAGAKVHPQVRTRAAGALLTWRLSHPFMRRPTFVKLEELPWEEQLQELRKPEVRNAILSEDDLPALSAAVNHNMHLIAKRVFDRTFLIHDSVSYEQPMQQSVAEIAKRTGRSSDEVIYDHLLGNDGTATAIMLPNYAGDNDSFHTMLSDPNTVVGLADGGAHCGAICDASCTTYLLTHWARDRQRGRLPLDMVVKKHTADNAALYGLSDRGTLEVGKRADLNIVDFDNLKIDPPRLVHDLPAGGPRFLQDAHGYRLTMVDGVVVRENDKDTGARPGRLVRGRR